MAAMSSRKKRHLIPDFEARSVALVTACLLVSHTAGTRAAAPTTIVSQVPATHVLERRPGPPRLPGPWSSH